MKQLPTSGIIASFFLLAATAYFAVLAFATEGFYGGADEIVHYWISRYSWQHPRLLLDLWGKPLFTTLSSPFSQFGIESLRLFNVIAGISTSFIVYRILKDAGVTHAWLGIPMTLASPVYFILLPTTLTEVLFSFVLILGAFLFLRKHYLWAAVVLSMLPFARNEGFVVLFAFALLFVWQRQFKVLPFLLTGYLLFSLVGLVVFNDFLWLWHQNPYVGSDLYAQGDLFHYVAATPRTTGLIITLFAVAAWLLLLIPKRLTQKWGFAESSLIIVSLITFSLYFAAHSYAWWSGSGNSLGLVRVIAAVSPMLALPATWLVSGIISNIKASWLQLVLAFILLIPIIRLPFNLFSPPKQLSEIEVLTKEAAAWLNESRYSDRMLYYYDPTFMFFKGGDVYDQSKYREQLPNKDSLSKDIMAGSIVVWDAHFGNNEGRTPRQRLLDDSGFQLIKSFVPPDTIWVLNGYPYEILVLERIEP